MAEDAPLIIVVNGEEVDAEQATWEALYHALRQSKASNFALRQRLEALEVDLRRLLVRCQLPAPLREQASASDHLQ